MYTSLAILGIVAVFTLGALYAFKMKFETFGFLLGLSALMVGCEFADAQITLMRTAPAPVVIQID